MRERRLDDALDPGEALRELQTLERDERRIDVRRRPEDGACDRVEAGPVGGELDEHRDGAVRLRRRLGEEPVRDLALHHHAPELDRRQSGEALGDDRRRHVVGQVGDELGRDGLERGEVERESVAPVELDVRPRRERREVRLEGAVELDGVDVAGAVGEVAGEDTEAGPHLEHDVSLVEPREPPDHGEDVLVGEEVLPEPLLGTDAHGNSKAADALASICAASSPASSPRTAASAATVWTTCAGSFVRPRTGCGAR